MSAASLSSGVNASSFSFAVSTVATSDPTYAAVVAPSADSITVSQAVTTHQQGNASSSSDGLSGRNTAIVVFFVLLVVIGLIVAIVVFFVLKGRKTDVSGAKCGEEGHTKDASTNAKGGIVELNAPAQGQATTKEIHSIV